MQIRTDADLNDSTICPSIAPVGFGSDGLQVKHSVLATMEQCQTVDSLGANGPCRSWGHILPNYYLDGGLGSGPPDSFIFFLFDDQVIFVTFATPTEATTDICSAQVCLRCDFAWIISVLKVHRDENEGRNSVFFKYLHTVL